MNEEKFVCARPDGGERGLHFLRPLEPDLAERLAFHKAVKAYLGAVEHGVVLRKNALRVELGDFLVQPLGKVDAEHGVGFRV